VHDRLHRQATARPTNFYYEERIQIYKYKAGSGGPHLRDRLHRGPQLHLALSPRLQLRNLSTGRGVGAGAGGGKGKGVEHWEQRGVPRWKDNLVGLGVENALGLQEMKEQA
jgi:hypothetical protein